MVALSLRKKSATVVMAIGVVCGSAENVQAANCSLRNPDRQIFRMFPQATSYRSVVKRIGATERGIVEARLGSSLGYNELGKHTLYLVLNESVPLGFVHGRSEIGQRGVVELVWALDLDMRIIDFEAQRCRDRHADAIKSPAFRRHFLGKTVDELRMLLLDDNRQLNKALMAVPKEAEHLCHLVTLSAIKTALVTRYVFERAVHTAQMLGHSSDFFPYGTKTMVIGEPYDDAAMRRVLHAISPDPPLVERESFAAACVYGARGRVLGVVVRCVWTGTEPAPTVWWALSPEGTIEKTLVVGGDDSLFGDAMTSLTGRRLGDLIGERFKNREPARRCAIETLAALQGYFLSDESGG